MLAGDGVLRDDDEAPVQVEVELPAKARRQRVGRCRISGCLARHVDRGTAGDDDAAGPLAQATNTGPYYATDGVGPDLMVAARDAVRRMIDYLGRSHGLAPADAYMLCSVTADLKVSEIVDAPNFIVSMYFPLSVLG